jgi:superfamily II RNA helicase
MSYILYNIKPMVKICDINNYPDDNELKYKEHFEKYPYELSIFQKHAVEGIIEGHHVLITSHTGTGKTMPAEFAIEHFVAKGKKVIYTGPIKSLINQKFYDFTNKYPHISFGILTGDIKFNPEADVLIVTAEILLNKLYQINSLSKNSNSSTNFDMDFQNELACVVIDEVHYVNDQSRGHVWENTLMMLPSHVQLVMLSATIDKPELFASWCEKLHKDSGKQVYLTNTTHRVVPLTHYSFITVTQGIFKAIKDKAVQEEIKNIINKPFVIQDSNGKFNDDHYFKMTKTLKLFESKDIRVKRAHVLNQVTKYLVENEMLPALCFVLSRKQLEICAHEITTNLQEFDTKVPYTVDYECEQILRSKLSNFAEYLHLPEYVNMLSLLRKGIAIHHSGVLPVLKEIVELLYSKGYIKLLFATETFSIGVNMPTKTVIFTDVNKFDGTTNRILYSHEMGQMSGRAGRRGIDTVGNCFHLNNLFRNVDSSNYKLMMNGKPQTLTSKFKISYNLLLNLLDNGDNNLINFASRSMVTGDINSQIDQLNNKISGLNVELNNIKTCANNLRTPNDILEQYIDLQKNKLISVNKKRKEIERSLQQIQDNHKFIEQDKITYQKITLKEKEIYELEKDVNEIKSYIKLEVGSVLSLLNDEAYIEGDLNDESSIKLTLKGKIASQLRETHCLVFAKLLENNDFDKLTSKQLISLFSIFTNISVQEDNKTLYPNSEDEYVQKNVVLLTELYEKYKDKELKYKIDSGVDYNIHYDLLNYLDEWCECTDIESCKLVLQKIGSEKQIFLGEFVKALLKINNISCEMEKIAELTGNILFLSKLKEIPNMTMKYVVTNQSLYV